MDNEQPSKRRYLSLIIGIAFVAYGSYRLFTYFNGAEYTTFRMVIAIGFVVLGAYDLYRFYSSLNAD